jgi:hypothetical protein
LDATSTKIERAVGMSVATVVVSVAIHVALGAGLLLWLTRRPLVAGPSPLREATSSPMSTASLGAIELPVVGEGTVLEDLPVDPRGDPPRVSGGATIARLDRGVSGHGGDVHVPVPALNLADDDDRMRLSPDLVSRLDRDQLQRMRVARERRSWEDRRSTTHPMELTLLVTGTGTFL